MTTVAACLNPGWRGRPRYAAPLIAEGGGITVDGVRRRADPAPPASHLGDHRADRLRRVQPPGQRERRQHMAHLTTPAPQPGTKRERPAARTKRPVARP